MSIKIKPPYNSDDMNIAVYKKDLNDGSAAKSNHTGIVLQKGMTPKMEEAAIAHETVHQMQQRNGDLDYDNENFYWKGKTYSRENLNEHNENLPWEKEAYKESNKILKGKQTKQKMKEKFQLRNGAGNGAAFKNLTDKNLMGPSADMCMADGTGGPDCPKPYDTTKKDKIKETKTPKQPKTKRVLEKRVFKDETFTPGSYVQEVGIGKDRGGKTTGVIASSTDSKSGKTTVTSSLRDVGTTPASKPGQSKKDFIKSLDGKGNPKRMAKLYDQYHKDPSTRLNFKQEEYTKRNKKGEGKMRVTTTRAGTKDGTKAARLTDLKVTKKKLVGGGYKTKSYSINEQPNTFAKNPTKQVSKEKLKRKTEKAKRKIGLNKKTTKVKELKRGERSVASVTSAKGRRLG
jgi:hypothetical protein